MKPNLIFDEPVPTSEVDSSAFGYGGDVAVLRDSMLPEQTEFEVISRDPNLDLNIVIETMRTRVEGNISTC